MYKSYFKLAWRRLINEKGYNFINIGGLAIGIVVSLIIILYFSHENSYDKFNPNAERVFVLNGKEKFASDSFDIFSMSYNSGPIISNNSPHVESYLRIYNPYTKVTIENPEINSSGILENKVLFADTNFFSFFSFSLKVGNIEEALKRPFTMVISEDAARKYFGNTNPIGKILKYNNSYNFEITGIAKNAPSNSSITYDFVVSLSSLFKMKEGEDMDRFRGNIISGAFRTYLLLKNKNDQANVQNLVQSLSKKDRDLKDISGRYFLSPFLDTHLNSVFTDNSNIKYLEIFKYVAALILLLSLINYISLSITKSTLKAKEIGVRKVVGSTRINIAQQFFIESSVNSFVAFIIGFILFFMTYKFFFNFIGLKIDLSFILSSRMFFTFTLLFLFIVFLSGAYPSLFLSSFKPLDVINNKFSGKVKGRELRKIFTIFQFTISVTLIIFSFTIRNQLHYLKNYNTGMSRENIVMIPFKNSIQNHYLAFKDDIVNLNGVSETATSNYPVYSATDNISVLPKNSSQYISLPMLNIDKNFISLFNIKWQIPPEDSTKGVIINKEAVKKLNLSSNPIDQDLSIKGGINLPIKGVVNNFNFSSLYNKLDGLCLIIMKDSSINWGSGKEGCLFIKFAPNVSIPNLITSIKNIYDNYDKTTGFEYSFVDDVYDAQYKSEQRLSKIITTFSLISIFIACLGFLGLSYFLIIQMNREISIRKVLGASKLNLLNLLSKQFLSPILISNIIAFPIAWYISHKWLQAFVYRIDIKWGYFLITFLATILIVYTIILFQSIKAGRINPIKYLKQD